MSTMLGRTIGKYELIELLGSGGMAEVYKGKHQKLDRIVAIKVLHPYLAVGKDFLERFTREAKAAATLRHPRIVQVHDFDVENGLYYMVMDYVDGGNLMECLDELSRSGNRLPLNRIVSVLSQAAEALDFAHQQGIIHRDIKPSNILLDKSGNAYLTDFGIARIFGSSHVTASGVLIGTPAYMSPEQGRGEVLAPASDIYSLGVVLYEMIAGNVPFSADTPVAVILKHIQEPLPRILDQRPEVPGKIEAVIQRALSKVPANRHTTAIELAKDLQTAIPEETTARLESAPHPPEPVQVSFSGLATVKLDEVEASDRASLATKVLVEEENTPLFPGHLVHKDIPTVKMVSEEPEATQEPKPVSQPSPIPHANTAKKLPWWQKKPLVFGLAGGALLIVIILLAVFLSPVNSYDCPTIVDCANLARELSWDGKKQDALVVFDRAISMVPPDGHMMNAVLWCDRAGVAVESGEIDEAIQNYDICIGWTQGDPAQEALRRAAMENLIQLRGP